MLKRTQAEYINFKNRTDKEKTNLFQYSGMDFAKKLLPVSFSNFNALYDKRLDVYRGDAFKDTTAEEIYFMYSKLIPLIGNTKDSLAYLAKIEKDNFDLEIFLDITNLLNTSYSEQGEVAMPGRWIIGGAKIKL